MDNDSAYRDGRIIIAGIPSVTILVLSIFFNACSIYFVRTAKTLHSFFATILAYRSICEVCVSSAIIFFWICTLTDFYPSADANGAVSGIAQIMLTQAYMLHFTASLNRSIAMYFPTKYSLIYENWAIRVVFLLGTTVLSIALVLLLLIDRCLFFVWEFDVSDFSTSLCMYEPDSFTGAVENWPSELLSTAQKTFCFAAVAIDFITLLRIILLSKNAQSETNIRNIRFFLQVFTQNAFLCVSVLTSMFYPNDDKDHNYFGIYWYTSFLYNVSFFVNSITLFIFNSEVHRSISRIFKRTQATVTVKSVTA